MLYGLFVTVMWLCGSVRLRLIRGRLLLLCAVMWGVGRCRLIRLLKVILGRRVWLCVLILSAVLVP